MAAPQTVREEMTFFKRGAEEGHRELENGHQILDMIAAQVFLDKEEVRDASGIVDCLAREVHRLLAPVVKEVPDARTILHNL